MVRFNDLVPETRVAHFEPYLRAYDACLRRRPEGPGLASTPAASTSLRSRLAKSEGCPAVAPQREGGLPRHDGSASSYGWAIQFPLRSRIPESEGCPCSALALRATAKLNLGILRHRVLTPLWRMDPHLPAQEPSSPNHGFLYVYLLQSLADPASFNTGVTRQLAARLACHNRGTVSFDRAIPPLADPGCRGVPRPRPGHPL